MRAAANGVRLYFDVEGCGLAARGPEMAARPTIVLLHGGPGADHSLFKPEFSAMADAAQVVYLDQRGSGRSGHGDPGLWTWDQWADDVAAFCQALGIEAPVLVGTSSPEAARAWAAHAMPLYGSASHGGMAARGARVLLNRDVLNRFRRGECGPLEVTAGDLGKVGCPVLVLAGEDDPVSPVASTRRVTSSARHPALEVRVFPGAGHGVFRQAPAQAFALLRAFLQEVPASQAAGTAVRTGEQ